jgi:hypothetical protein
MSAMSRVLDHIRTPRIEEPLGKTGEMYHDVSGNFLDVYLEIIKLHHAIRTEISATDLILWTIYACDLAANHCRDSTCPASLLLAALSVGLHLFANFAINLTQADLKI